MKKRKQGKDVTQKMQDINEAYAILKDPVKKARYDAFVLQQSAMVQPLQPEKPVEE